MRPFTVDRNSTISPAMHIGSDSDAWNTVIKIVTGELLSVTKRRLQLNSPVDDTTGWYSRSYAETTVQMLLVEFRAQNNLYRLGVYMKAGAVGLSLDPFSLGDQVITRQGDFYEVTGVEPVYRGTSLSHRVVSLTLQPFHNFEASNQYVAAPLDDARHRTKVWLDRHLNYMALPRFLVCYSNPPYPLTRVLTEKHKDAVFCIGDPVSTPHLNADKTVDYYEETVPITICCVDKSNILGTELKWQAETELRRLCDEKPFGSIRLMDTRRDTTEWLESLMLYQTEFQLTYRRGPG